MRTLVTALLTVCCVGVPDHVAWPQASKLQILKEVVEAIESAGKALTSLTEGVSSLVRAGASGYSYVSAERERNRLVDISARASQLRADQNVVVIRTIDEYLAKKSPTSEDWSAVQQGITQTLSSVTALLKDVKAERSDFVLEGAYQDLLRTLGSRQGLLEKLRLLGPPSTPEERNALRDVSKQYKTLIAKLGEATNELNKYLKDKKPG
jgi:hypothetical protein